LKFKAFDITLQCCNIGEDVIESGTVFFGGRQFEKIKAIRKPLLQSVKRADDRFETGFSATQFLRLFRLAPDIRIFQFSQGFFELLFLGIEVKDTPSDHCFVISGLLCGCEPG
jgi:hypothetical protein